MTSVFPFSAPLFAQWLCHSLAMQPAGKAEDGVHAAHSSPDADHFLMARLQNGDDAAFSELFNKWKRPLISFFFRSLGDYHLSEDLTLEVAHKVYRAKDRYKPHALFSTWLFRIARNCLLDRARSKSTVFQVNASGTTANWTYPVTEPSVDDEQLRIWEDWLATALETIPESEKTALLLVAQQGMKPSEAAEVMQIKPNHLRVLLNKARNRLRELRGEIL